jgi:hypothetical protein
MIALAVETDNKHGTPVAIAGGLVGQNDGGISAARGSVADALTEATVTELVGAAKEFDGIFGIVGSEHRLHGAEVLVAKGQNVRPHAK